MQVIYERIAYDTNPSAQQANALYRWVKDFSPEDIEFLLNQPYTITVTSYNVVVVHAGLVPGVSLDCQQPVDMMTMRGVVKDLDGSYSGTMTKAFGLWAASWHGPQHVYFGHNAACGLQQHPFATGLDTGCVYGRELTGAMISSPNQQPVLYSVTAKQVYRVPDK